MWTSFELQFILYKFVLSISCCSFSTFLLSFFCCQFHSFLTIFKVSNRGQGKSTRPRHWETFYRHARHTSWGYSVETFWPHERTSHEIRVFLKVPTCDFCLHIPLVKVPTRNHKVRKTVWAFKCSIFFLDFGDSKTKTIYF